MFLTFWQCGLTSMTQSRLQNRHFQNWLNRNRITIVLEGVRARALRSVKPDQAILLINFPEINHQFKVRTLFIFIIVKKSMTKNCFTNNIFFNGRQHNFTHSKYFIKVTFTQFMLRYASHKRKGFECQKHTFIGLKILTMYKNCSVRSY